MNFIRHFIGSVYERISTFGVSGDSALHSALKIFLYFTAYPFMMAAIYLDRRVYLHQKVFPNKVLSRNPLIPFPRRPREIREDLGGFFRELARSAPLIFIEAANVGMDVNVSPPPRIVYVSASTFEPLDSEPEKNEAVLRVVYKYQVIVVGLAAPVESTIDIFVKTPSAREYSMSLKALSATFNARPKECLFYSVYMPAITGKGPNTKPFPFPVPPPIYTAYCRMFESYIVVNKMILSEKEKPYYSIPDWKMQDINKMRHMMRVVAQFHATSWELKTTPQFDFKAHFAGEARSAVGWINGGMSLFFDKKASPVMKAVWKGITARLSKEPLVMSHGDYRPGNMLWKPEDEATQVSTEKYPAMVATDLELCVVTPYMWDATYAIYIGLPVDFRREHEGALIKEYTRELRYSLSKIIPPTSGKYTLPVAAGSEDATILHEILGLALFYYGWTLATLGEMPSTEKDKSIQGNTAEDGTAWSDRMIAMLQDTIGDSASPKGRAKIANELGLIGDAGAETLDQFFRETHESLLPK